MSDLIRFYALLCAAALGLWVLSLPVSWWISLPYGVTHGTVAMTLKWSAAVLFGFMPAIVLPYMLTR